MHTTYVCAVLLLKKMRVRSMSTYETYLKHKYVMCGKVAKTEERCWSSLPRKYVLFVLYYVLEHCLILCCFFLFFSVGNCHCPQGAFEGLSSLEWLKLNGNRLKRISGLASLPLALKGVYLEENPWECDCRLLELRLWLSERKVANSVEPRCSGPDRLANLTLKDVSEENFACIPELSPTTMYQKIGKLLPFSALIFKCTRISFTQKSFRIRHCLMCHEKICMHVMRISLSVCLKFSTNI